MKGLTEYITEYVSSGTKRKYISFPTPTELKDINKLIEFLETNGFSDVTQRIDTDIMSEILSAFKKSDKPVYVYNKYDKYGVRNGESSYWLRFFYTKKPTRNITEENPIFTVSYTYSCNYLCYYIEKTVGDKTITEISRDEFMDLLNKHFGWG